MYQQAILAVGLLLENNGAILLGKRASDRDFAPEIWELPAGRVEEGEELEEALKREALEELGIEVTTSQIVDAYQFKRADQPMLLLTYYCEYNGEIRRSDEHKELRWATPQQALDLFNFPQQKETISKYLQFRKE